MKSSRYDFSLKISSYKTLDRRISAGQELVSLHAVTQADPETKR